MFWPASMVPMGSMVTEIITGMGWPSSRPRSLNGQNAGFDVARVLASFEQQQIGAAFDQASGLIVEIFAQAARR